MIVPPGLVRAPEGREPFLPSAARLDAVREDSQHRGAVADDPCLRSAVPAEFGCVGMDVNELRLRWKATELEAEVEWRTDDAQDVGLGLRLPARVLKEQRVVGRQGAATGAVQIDRQLPVLRERAELLPGAVPPDPGACD